MASSGEQALAGGYAGDFLRGLLGMRQQWLDVDQNPKAIATVSTLLGRMVLNAVFVGALSVTGYFSASLLVLIAITLVGCSLFPERRLLIMSLAGLFYVLARPFRSDQQRDLVLGLKDSTPAVAELPAIAVYAPVVASFLLVCGICLHLQKRFSQYLLAQRPVLMQFLVLAGLTILAVQLPNHSLAKLLVWSFVTVYSASFFFLAYAFADQRAKDQTPVGLRLGFMRPFWGGSSIPLKGLHFFKRFEAKTPEELSKVQLRALKLAVWAVILSLVYLVCDFILHDWLKLPRMLEAIGLVATGEGLSLGAAWGVVGANFVLDVIGLAAGTHALVAIVRMAGYGIPRNVSRPLTSRSVAEFWNRYFYYFKELLVDFFFYPAFVRYFKKSPKLRIAFATFCAAFVGNVLFSVLSQMHLFNTGGIVDVALHFENYMFYALLLTAALIVSQLNPNKPKPEHGHLRYNVLPRVQVLGFFALLQVFSDETGIYGLAERFDFLGHLFLL